MADVAITGTPSLSSLTPGQDKTIVGLVAGETIAPGHACHIASTGKVMKSIGTAANAAAKVDGFALGGAALNEPVTLVFDVNLRYGSGMTPGTRLFLSATAGGGLLADAASTGGTAPVGFVIDATRIRVWQSRY